MATTTVWSVAKETVPSGSDSLIDATLTAMAGDFHREWQRRFARPGVRPCATVQGDTLLLRMEEAFTPEETELSRHPGGPATVRKQLEALLDALYPWLAHEVECRLACYVGESRVLMNFADESISYAVTLRDMPRVLTVWQAQRTVGAAQAN